MQIYKTLLIKLITLKPTILTVNTAVIPISRASNVIKLNFILKLLAVA